MRPSEHHLVHSKSVLCHLHPLEDKSKHSNMEPEPFQVLLPAHMPSANPEPPMSPGRVERRGPRCPFSLLLCQPHRPRGGKATLLGTPPSSLHLTQVPGVREAVARLLGACELVPHTVTGAWSLAELSIRRALETPHSGTRVAEAGMHRGPSFSHPHDPSPRGFRSQTQTQTKLLRFPSQIFVIRDSGFRKMG